MWDQNVGLSQIIESGAMICFAAKFLDERAMHYHSLQGDLPAEPGAPMGPAQKEMIEAAHTLLDEADVVMHYNGKKFDIPHLNRAFLEAGLSPPSPYQQIDLCTVSRRFKFPSNKLEYVSRRLGLAGKVGHEGFDLWKKCLAGDATAWRKMEKYNRQDVKLLEELYELLQPWIPNHPNRALDQHETVCPSCGSHHLQRRGIARTKVSEFQQYQCQDCKAWSRSTKRIDFTEVVQTTM